MLNEKLGDGTHSTKMGDDRSTKHTPKCPKICLPNFSAQAEKFAISIKKGFTGQDICSFFLKKQSIVIFKTSF